VAHWSLIGLGVDVVDLDRFAGVLERRARFATRVFTDAERAYCDQAKGPMKRVERYAVRFAAKEAVMKVLGVGLGEFGFHDVEVAREESGAPALALHGKAAAVAAERGATVWHVSLSHSDVVAIAVVAAE
jgi:holo-[acyl-carrier protein] synthase